MLHGHGAELMLNTAYDEGERPEQPERARVVAHGDTALYFGCRMRMLLTDYCWSGAWT